MSRSIHFFRRYQGHKLHLAEVAARKSAFVADLGDDRDRAPFWCEAFCDCGRVECADCGEDARYWAEREDRFSLRQEIALWAPEPPQTLTGKLIAVEWEDASGGRWWQTIDSGQLDNYIWHATRRGSALSDIDDLSPVAVAA